jgi:hypothetical protein
LPSHIISRKSTLLTTVYHRYAQSPDIHLVRKIQESFGDEESVLFSWVLTPCGLAGRYWRFVIIYLRPEAVTTQKNNTTNIYTW